MEKIAMSCVHYIFIVLILQVIVSHQFDAQLTIQNMYTNVKNGSSSLILCHPTNDKPVDYHFYRTDSGQGSKMPTYSDVRRMSGPPYSLTLIMEHHHSGQSRFGVYTCQDNISETQVTAFKLSDPNIADVIALRSFITKNLRDEVNFRVNVTGLDLPLVWSHNQVVIPAWTNKTSVKITNVNTSHAGIYECYYETRRHLGVHALIQLLVRGCMADEWGKKCEFDCPSCYNGGICHDEKGICICPPGFDGDNCEFACGKNSFGKDCKKKCDYENPEDPDFACGTFLFCAPHPYGCGCAAGFTGELCTDVCEENYYGSDCSQSCHCAGNDVCDRITGNCTSGCDTGWSGNSCEVEEKSFNIASTTSPPTACPKGTFGPPLCDNDCNCLNNSIKCDPLSGECNLGCKTGWTSLNCSVCFSGLFGPNCNMTCHCQNGNNSCDFRTGNCDGGCSAGYSGIDCQNICSGDMYGPNCSQPCLCENGGSCDPFNGSCYCIDSWKGLFCNETGPIIISFEPLEVNTGAIVNLSCIIQSSTILNDVNITSSDFSDLLTTIEEINSTLYEAFVNTNVSRDMMVNCSVANDYGSDHTQFSLTTIDPPILYKRPWAINITENAVALKWNKWTYRKDGGGTLNDEIKYRVVIKMLNSDWIIYSWHRTNETKIDKLLPDVEYEIAIQCIRPGAGGIGGYGPSILVRTSCRISSANTTWLNALNATEVGSTHLFLKWISTYANDVICENITYELIWSDNRSSKIEKLQIFAGVEKFNLTELQPNTDYEIQISLMAKDKVVGIPTTISVKTNRTPPVRNIQIKMAPGEADLSWEEPLFVNETEYYHTTLELLEIIACGNDTNTTNSLSILRSDTPNIKITNLHFAAIYSAIIEPYVLGEWGQATQINFTTLTKVPDSSPSNLTCTQASDDEAKFEWNSVPCELIYDVRWNYEFAIFDQNNITVIDFLNVSKNEITLTTETFGDEYTFAVRLSVPSGYGPAAEFKVNKKVMDVSSISTAVSNATVLNKTTEFSNETSVSNETTDSNETVDTNATVFSNETVDTNATVFSNETVDTNATVFSNETVDTNATVFSNETVDTNATVFSNETVDTNATVFTNETAISNETVFTNETAISNETSVSNETADSNETSVSNETADSNETSVSNETADSNEASISNATVFINDTAVSNETADTNKTAISNATEFSTETTVSNEIEVILYLPPIPELYKMSNGSVILTIFPSRNENLVRAYQVIVEDQENKEIINDDNLNDFYTASVQGKNFYVTAEVNSSYVEKSGYNITVGNDLIYNLYHNVHLNAHRKYKFHVRTVGWNEEYSPLSSSQFAASKSKPADNSPCVILKIGCIWFIILVVSIVIICLVIFLVSLAVIRKQRVGGSLQIQQSEECLDQIGKKGIIKRNRRSRTYSASHSYSKTT